MSRETQNRTGAILNLAASFALFVFLPALIAVVLGIHAISLEKERAFTNVKDSLETRLTQFIYSIDDDTFLTRVARGAWVGLRRKSDNISEITRLVESLQRFLPVEFDVYLFNDEGNLITPSKFRLRSRYVASRLWELINAAPEQQSGLFKKFRKPVKSMFGGEFKVAQLLEKKDGLLPIILKHQSGRIYWNRAETGRAGLLMVFWEIPSLEFRLQQQKNREKEPFKAGFARFAGGMQQNFGSAFVPEDRAETVETRLHLMNQPWFLDRDQLWIGRKIGDAHLSVCSRFDVKRFQLYNWSLMTAVMAVVLLSLIFFIRSGMNIRLSIRVKLMVLFLTAVLMPIMGFAFLGFQYHADREKTLIAEVANNSRQMLFNLDESLSRVGEANEPELNRLLPFFALDDGNKIRKALQPKIAGNELVTVEVRDVQAKIKFTQVNELFFEGMKDVSEAFSRFCIDTALGTSLGDSVDPIISMVVKAPEGGMFFLFDRPGEIHPLEFGPVPLLIYWQIIENVRAEKLYVFVVQSASLLLKKMVRAMFKKDGSSEKNSAFITAARRNSSNEWFPGRPASSLPLKRFAEMLEFSDKPLDAEVKIHGKTWLVTGQKGKYAGEYSFFAFYPREIIEDDLRKIRKLIFACMFLFLTVAMLTGNILSYTFLEPVQKLSEGVNAIKRRDGGFRILTTQHDEFGDLSNSFNHMIEDLKEMQLARDVQESLLPSHFPEIPGYQISFANRMASDVGGDYFDLHQLDENRVCLLIGDVTGHGVSSALVMAMAKAIVYQGLKEQKSLVELFADLNLTIHTYFKIPPARKMITLFAAILDIAAGSITSVNAGHNFPVKIKAEGGLEDFSAVHLPIGAARKLRGLKISNYSLAPGETVVFYTDGIIEVKNKQAQMYGYDDFKEHLRAMAAEPAEVILDRLMARYDEFLDGAEPDDDITVIVLKRNS